jgi:chemotaxis protein CheY-P-specific phosphatase CheC
MLEALNENTVAKLDKLFDAGYTNAASALTRLTEQQIGFNQLHAGLFSVDEIKLNDAIYSTEDCVLLTTEIFGDITGKSYLFLSDKEVALLAAGIPIGKEANINLKEEFLKEVDNILSASVITKLSNELKVKMYGDVPHLQGKTLTRIENTLEKELQKQTGNIYINIISFSIAGYPKLNPVFIWILESNVLTSVKRKSTL